MKKLILILLILCLAPMSFARERKPKKLFFTEAQKILMKKRSKQSRIKFMQKIIRRNNEENTRLRIILNTLMHE